jgi:hypothetical protein
MPSKRTRSKQDKSVKDFFASKKPTMVATDGENAVQVKNVLGVDFVKAEWSKESGVSFADNKRRDDIFMGPIIATQFKKQYSRTYFCSNCPELWPCFEVYEDTMECRQGGANLSWGFKAGVFRTRACFYFHKHLFSIDGYEKSESEDIGFRTLQADNGGIAVKPPRSSV